MKILRIQNFGGNVDFSPAEFFEPSTEEELLEILEKNRVGNIRVVASKHSWSDAIVTDGVLISMANFRSVEIINEGDSQVVRVGAGCQIKHLIAELQRHGMTLPSIGLITEQTIAGATATGTHGSGKQSLSHFIQSIRVACFHRDSDHPTVHTVDDGEDLRAARCSIG